MLFRGLLEQGSLLLRVDPSSKCERLPVVLAQVFVYLKNLFLVVLPRRFADLRIGFRDSGPGKNIDAGFVDGVEFGGAEKGSVMYLERKQKQVFLPTAYVALVLVLSVGLADDGACWAQQVGVSTPFTSVSDSYYENHGVGFGFSLPGGRGPGSKVVGYNGFGRTPNLRFTQNGAASAIWVEEIEPDSPIGQGFSMQFIPEEGLAEVPDGYVAGEAPPGGMLNQGRIDTILLQDLPVIVRNTDNSI